MAHILLVEDNKTLGKNISRYLELKWYSLHHCESAEAAQKYITITNTDLILLDIHLPGINGDQMLKNMRESGDYTPVIFLTSKDSDDDIIAGLKLGADDYVSKPFDYEVLIARIESVLRRWNMQKIDNFKIWNYEVFLEKQQVYDNENAKYIYLSDLEFRLLKYLIENKEKVCDRRSIYESVWWDFEEYYFSRTVDVYISYLRKKLWNTLILTRKWSGYILNSQYGNTQN